MPCAVQALYHWSLLESLKLAGATDPPPVIPPQRRRPTFLQYAAAWHQFTLVTGLPTLAGSAGQFPVGVHPVFHPQ